MKILFILFFSFSLLFSESFSYTKHNAHDLYKEALRFYKKKQYTKAIEKFEICQQYLPCAKFLAQIYSEAKIVNKDIQKTIYYYEIAINNGDKESLHNLANYYYHNADIENAKIYYQKAADLGYPESMYNLGRIYEADNNMTEALRCYETASRKNIPQADYSLAVYYYNKKNLNLSLLYFNKAAKQGFKPALKALQQINNRAGK